jgi:hypothetical protein
MGKVTRYDVHWTAGGHRHLQPSIAEVHGDFTAGISQSHHQDPGVRKERGVLIFARINYTTWERVQTGPAGAESRRRGIGMANLPFAMLNQLNPQFGNPIRVTLSEIGYNNSLPLPQRKLLQRRSDR